MSCPACDSLKAKKRACWRHPEGSLQPIEIDAQVCPVASARDEAVLAIAHPAHASHRPKLALPVVCLALEFVCSCGARLSYSPILAAWAGQPGPQAGTVKP